MIYHGIPDLEHLEEWLALGVPFEYDDFMLPHVLEDPAKVRELIRAYSEPRRDRSRDTLHGPFLDITVHSSDRLIREASEYRIRQACDIARQLQVKGIVLHTNFIPNFYVPSYRQGWVDRNEEFFRRLLEEEPGLWFYMENMFDEEPDCLVELAKRMQGERFAVCLDLAHAYLSKTPVAAWQEACGPYVAHYHINDNHGKLDEHLALGDGTAPWEEILPRMNRDVSVLIEVGSLEKYEKSVAFLEKVSETAPHES